ncbi:unnamed protein product [Spirodela intermedia]|uniref:Uncharacterized protein n=2 Tax=Spirodela intermedia TaxID=51605 RepID=A0A7I8IJ18_SPIIN|nr:unnamed protein product [Spirodela intermedia]CAA6657339.1 unnamed protein product [Spirodela intermedia]CAA7393388.1 unnamed protein product [Spirodela intermedia]
MCFRDISSWFSSCSSSLVFKESRSSPRRVLQQEAVS